MEQTSVIKTSSKQVHAAKVLIVDDNSDNLHLMQIFLETQGYQVSSAMNGQEAIEMAIKITPDLILMDLQMPYMDGYEATKRIKARPNSKHIPIIALSAYIGDHEVEELRDNGFDGCAAKPVDLSPNGLIVQIRTFLEKRANALSHLDAIAHK